LSFSWAVPERTATGVGRNEAMVVDRNMKSTEVNKRLVEASLRRSSGITSLVRGFDRIFDPTKAVI
jgi:hypothetical protein